MDFEFFDHTADAKFRAYGKTLEEAFGNSARALYALMTEIEKVEPKVSHILEVSANKLTTLLFDFLSDLLVLTDSEGFLVHDVAEIVISGEEGAYTLKAVVRGDSGSQYEVFTHVKAMTYSEMFIKEEEQFVIQVVPDI